jgi:ABC-2 type transport system ATP-binding protein
MLAAVSAKNLVVRLGRHAVISDLYFDLPDRKIIGLLGPSGAGKTTLLRAVVGRQRVSSGLLQVLGLNAGSVALRARIGYLTQAPSVYGDLSVGENLHYFAAMLGAGSVKQALVATRLEPYVDRLTGTLSGGQRSRVSLAVALLGQPELLVLDEPTVGLDPVLRQELWQLFRMLADAGTTLLISSHVMDEAERCDHLLLLRDGRLLAQGTPHELRVRTATPSVEAAFLSLVGATETL